MTASTVVMFLGLRRPLGVVIGGVAVATRLASSRFPARANTGGTGFAVALVIGSCMSLQFGAAFAIKLFPNLGPSGVTTLRLFIAGLVLTAFTRPRVRRWSSQQWVAVVLFGAAMGGMNGFFYEGISRIPIGPAVAIEFLGPLGLAAILSRRAKDFAWIAMALAGVMVLGFDKGGDLNTSGVLCILGAAFFWAMYILTSERVGRVLDGAGGLAVAMLIGALVPLPLGFHGAVQGVTHPQYLVMAVATALLASLIPYGLELSALRILPKTTFGVLLALEPVFAAVGGWLLLDQGISHARAAAVLMVVVAGVGSAMTSAKKDETAGVVAADAPDDVAAAGHN